MSAPNSHPPKYNAHTNSPGLGVVVVVEDVVADVVVLGVVVTVRQCNSGYGYGNDGRAA